MRKFLPFFALFLSIFVVTDARADESIALGVGYYNVFDSEDTATWLAAEYRAPYIWNKLQPIIGIAGNTEGAFYGHAGFMYDWNVVGNFYLIPSLAAGLYAEGDSKDLGGAIEFRSSIEGAYRFDNGMRIGVALQHLSNAHIYEKNPGTEILMLNYSVPMATLR